MSAPWRLAILALLSSLAAAREPEAWTLARGRHFEVYSHGPAAWAPSLLAGFERMHAFFARQTGGAPDPHRPVRVICFGGIREYESYRLSPGADAYYVGSQAGDYIVMPSFAPGDFHIPAHEYAHLLIHSAGLRLPRWVAEGISEVASTVQIRDRASSVGGDLPDRSHELGVEKWMPWKDLFAVREDDSGPIVFYSQSWALTAMLMLSPSYGPHFRLFLGSVASGVGSEAALRAVYHTSPDMLTRDVLAWLAHIPPAVPLEAVDLAPASEAVAVSTAAAHAMLADLKFAIGDLNGAEAMYRALSAEFPSAEAYSALGLIALRKDDAPAALAAWQRAMELGISDAGICYRYAVLADQRGLGAGQIRGALERAISLRPDFDDAHFHLALMDKNINQPGAAIAHLKAMRSVSPARAFAYWCAMADAFLDLGHRQDARAAAQQAFELATSDAEREHADQIRYMAETDISVQLTSGPDGRPHFRTVRVPHDQPPRNPFIEPGDGIQRAEASLKQIECAEDGIHIVVSNLSSGRPSIQSSSQSGDLKLSVPDPSRVQIRNTPDIAFEFTCGPQSPRNVTVEYTAKHVLRGLELH